MRRLQKISGVAVLDLVSGDILGDRDIVLDRGRIVSLERTSGQRSGRGRGAELSAKGLYAIPGLIDTHVHAMGLLVDALPEPADLLWMMRQQRHNLRAFLRSGVTTIRDMGAPLHLIRWYAALARRGIITAPRILAAGPVLTVAGGYPYFIPKTPRALEWTLGPLVIELRSLGHARAVVRRLARARVDCIKVCYQTARYDDARTPLRALPRPTIAAIIDEAASAGVKVAIHHIYRDDLRAFLDLPFDSLEHLPIDEVLTDDQVASIVERGLPVSTTMMTYGIIDHLDEIRALLTGPTGRLEAKPAAFLYRAVHAMETGAEVTDHIGRAVIERGSTAMRESLKKLHQAGAVISFGTDSGGAITPPGFPHWELADMVRAGLSPLEALRTATTTAASVLALPELGILRPGAVADVVLLRRNPLEDISAVKEVVAVVQAGRLVHGGPLE